jgi:hypothetical protein
VSLWNLLARRLHDRCYREEIGLKFACFLSLVVTGALTASALAQQAPAVKESPASGGAVHAPAQATPSAKENAGRPNGATGAGASGKGAGGNGAEQAKGATPSPGRESGTGAEPIDTRITVQPRTTRKLPPGNEKKLSVPKMPSIPAPALQAIPRGANAPTRNAIGVPLVDHARAHAPIHAPQEGRRPGALGSFGSAGVAMASHPIAVPGGAAAPARNPAVITGTGIARPGSGPGTLGGPARNAAIINGTRIRPKP